MKQSSIPSHFVKDHNENYDILLTIHVNAKSKMDRDDIINRIYVDLPQDEFLVHAMIPTDSDQTLSRLILLRKKSDNKILIKKK